MKNKIVSAVKALFCFIVAASLVLARAVMPKADTTRLNDGDFVSGSLLASNENYSLLLNETTNSVMVADTKTGAVKWNSVVTNEICNLDDCSDVFQNYMQSMLVIHYALNSDTNGNRIDAYSGDPDNEVKIKKTADGADFSYSFTGPKISCTLEVRLTEDGVSFNIPFESIKEKGKYSLLSIEVAPFFGAAAEEDKGYIFYPESGGALTYFENISQKSKSATEITLDIYGNSNLETIMEEDAALVAPVPVYGIKRGDTAFVAVITKGDSDAKINVRPAVQTSSMDINCAGFEFTYHYQYIVYLSNIVKNGKNSATNVNGSKVDKEIVKGDRGVDFFFLENEEADYSGMANRYRKYLLDNKQLKSTEKVGYDKLAITFLMGVCTEGELFGNNFVEMTEYSKAQEIVEDYLAQGIDSMLVNLRGWGRSGYLSYPQNFSAVSALGGKRNLKKLSAFLKKNNVPLTLESSVIYTTDSVFGLKGKSSLKGTGIPVADDEEEIYLLSPDSAFSKLKKGYKKINKYGGAVSLDDIGSLIYYNYNKRDRISRKETIELWQDAAGLSEFSAVQGSNAYMYSSADWIYDIKFDSNKSLICDRNIPFVSMVLYNSLMLTSDAGNYAYDMAVTKLKWIEYGCSPYFELTDKSPKLLRDTEYNYLFSSKNDEWKDNVVDIYNEFNAKLSSVSESFITDHAFITDELIMMTYENGSRILLNYGTQDAEFDGKKIEAKSYLLY